MIYPARWLAVARLKETGHRAGTGAYGTRDVAMPSRVPRCGIQVLDST
jgi:hypothetical protein